MPEQHTPNVGDILDPEQMDSLPIGSVVRDCDGDTYERKNSRRLGWERNRMGAVDWTAQEVAGACAPAVLVSCPGETPSPQPDLYQQARIALRDRYGVEPDEDDIQRVCEAIDEGNLTPSAAVSALSLAKAYEEQKAQAAPASNTFLLVLVEGADATTQFVVADDTTSGLARLRAHAALDSLLDQHGISR